MKGKAPRGHLERIICNPFVWSGLKTLQGITISSLGSRPTFTSFIEFFFTLCRVSTYCLFSYHSGFPSNWELAEGLSPFQWPGHNSGCHYKVTWELLKTPHVRASDKFIRVSEKWDLGMAFFKSSKSSNVQPGTELHWGWGARWGWCALGRGRLSWLGSQRPHPSHGLGWVEETGCCSSWRNSSLIPEAPWPWRPSLPPQPHGILRTWMKPTEGQERQDV